MANKDSSQNKKEPKGGNVPTTKTRMLVKSSKKNTKPSFLGNTKDKKGAITVATYNQDLSATVGATSNKKEDKMSAVRHKTHKNSGEALLKSAHTHHKNATTIPQGHKKCYYTTPDLSPPRLPRTLSKKLSLPHLRIPKPPKMTLFPRRKT